MATARLATAATSREVTLFLYYMTEDVKRALRIAAGIAPATSTDKRALDLVTTPPSNSIIDILDAYSVAYRAAHPEAVP